MGILTFASVTKDPESGDMFPVEPPKAESGGRGTRRVVCAAIRHRDSGDIILGPRHFDMTMHKQIANYKIMTAIWNRAEQGFIDNFGVFMTRKEAWEVAAAANQIIYTTGSAPGILYSENLY